MFETELALDGGRGAVISAGGYAWALACDHLEIVHCRGTHMNLMTPESEGGDLLETIAPHLSYELARAWSDVAPVESVVAESIVESPSTLDRCDDDDALSRAALARLRASGELRASAPGRRWNRHEWHPSLRLPAWTRPGTVVETFAGSNGAAGVRLPALDLAVGDVVMGLNDRAWRLAGFDDADDASRRGVRECAAYREATPLDWSNDARSTSRRPPSPTLVVVFVQDLMERVSEWSRVALAATAPVIGAHVPSRQKRQKSRRVEDEREPSEGDEADSRAAAVVLAAARAAVTLEARASSPPSPSPALAFVALPGTTAARVALHAATQCRLRGLADTCALVVAPREAPERPPERTRIRDSSSDRDSSDAHSDASSSVGDAGSDSDSDSHAGDVAMQAIAASAAETDASRGEWVRRLRAWTRRSRGTTSSTSASASASASSSSAVAAARAETLRRRPPGATRRGWAEETAATETKYAAVRDACVRAMGPGIRVSCASVALDADFYARERSEAFL